MQLFLLKKLDERSARLEPTEAHHCLNVLRHSVGDLIHAIDGQGTYYETRLIKTGKKEAMLELIRAIPGWGEHPYSIRLGVSPLRLKDRFEWLLEKAVELGVTEIIPVSCARSHPYRMEGSARIEKIMLAATKQSLRSAIPALHPIMPFSGFVETYAGTGSVIAHIEATQHLSDLFPKLEEARTFTLLIGPEGDFTEEELEAAQRAGFERVRLGDQRLRAETAAIHLLSLLKGILRY